MEEKKTTRKPRKKPEAVKETPESIKEAPAPKKEKRTPVKEVPEAVYIYHSGDDIHKIAKLLTGHSYMVFKVLEYNHKSFDELKDGDLIKWGL